MSTVQPRAFSHIGPVARAWFAAAAHARYRRWQVLGGLGLLATLLGAWPASGQTAIEQAATAALDPLPASFIGDLPCADCPGIRFQLDLYPIGHSFSA